MLSTMTVKIQDAQQAITKSGRVIVSGTLIFRKFHKEVVEDEISFEAHAAAALPISNSVGWTGVATGYVEYLHKLPPVYKIDNFIPIEYQQVTPTNSLDRLEEVPEFV